MSSTAAKVQISDNQQAILRGFEKSTTVYVRLHLPTCTRLSRTFSALSPGQSRWPIDFWTTREIADEATMRKVVTSISTSQVGRLLRSAMLQPHRVYTGRPVETKTDRRPRTCKEDWVISRERRRTDVLV